MLQYLGKRLMLMIPTLLGITLVTFALINAAPGGPIEQKIQQMRFAGGSGAGDYGTSEEVIKELKAQYGFDKPAHVRYFIWLKNILTLDFGESFSYQEPVIDVIKSKFPVSLQFGIASLFFLYLISVPLGVLKAIKEGSHFDALTSVLLIVTYSVPPLVLGILLRVYFTGEVFVDWFPLGDLYSDNYSELTLGGKILDRIHHFVLPLMCYMIGSFAVLTFLMKNSLLDEIKLDYIRTARAKGLNERTVIFRHALRNALIPIATGLGSYLGLFFAGSIIIEQIFNLDGMGLLGYKSVLDRDYNVIMCLIFFQATLTLVGRLLSDITYVFIDPRIDFQ